jgi:heptosyltransferase III
MITWPRFKEIWIHRYHKFFHILDKYLSVGISYAKLSGQKWQLNNRPLVAIVLSEQMGDIVACEPISREVRRLHPTAHIIWFVRKQYLDLVIHNPNLDGYVIEKCPGQRTRLLDTGIFDHVYNLHLSNRRCKYCAELPVNSVADARNITYANYYNHGDLLYVFSQAAGLPALTADPQMYIPALTSARVQGLNLPSNAVVIHCRSSYAPRDWPAQKWNQLVAWLLENYSCSVIEIGLQPTVQQDDPRFINLCGQLSMLETAEVIKNARLFIGIDSGPAHFANAMGTEGVILLGQLFDYVDYLPYSGRYKRGEGVTILNWLGHPCSELPFNWVQEAVMQHLAETAPQR